MNSSSNVTKDFTGHPAFKIVVHGPPGVGKTTILRLLTSLKKIEDPPKLASDLSSIESPSGSTVFFDKVTFLAGDFDFERERGARIHVWATAGGMKHQAQREITFEGTNGIILILSPFSNQLVDNSSAIKEILDLGFQDLPLQVVVNKADLISKQDLSHVTNNINEFLEKYNLSTITPPIFISAAKAAKDLVALLQSANLNQCLTNDGRIKRECRPKSIDDIAKPIRIVTEEIIRLKI